MEGKEAMLTTEIAYSGKPCVVVCDGNCAKAWGINNRPRVEFDPKDPDDMAFLADGELGEAPRDPGTYEGGHGKPGATPSRHNKWCARECERSETFDRGQPVVARDLSRRLYNQPWKHAEAKA